MTQSFRVLAAPRFQRLTDKLNRHHPEFADVYASAIAILKVDPYNATRNYPIKKLESQGPREGQYRLRIGRWHFRYDVDGNDVVLKYCGLRREGTYD
jgi:hypothetical protein